MDFNPRAPCGARLYSHFNPNPCGKFQSTRPVRGATASGHSFCPVTLFQSTRPVRGATCSMRLVHLLAQFQSTRPVRGATEWNQTEREGK